MKMTSNGRQPQNIKSWMKTTSPWVEPTTPPSQLGTLLEEMRRKLNNQNWLNKFQKESNSALIGCDTKVQMHNMKITSHGKRPQMKDNLKILIVENISIHWSNCAQILSLKLMWPNKVKWIRWKMTSNGR